MFSLALTLQYEALYQTYAAYAGKYARSRRQWFGIDKVCTAFRLVLA